MSEPKVVHEIPAGVGRYQILGPDPLSAVWRRGDEMGRVVPLRDIAGALAVEILRLSAKLARARAEGQLEGMREMLEAITDAGHWDTEHEGLGCHDYDALIIERLITAAERELAEED